MSVAVVEEIKSLRQAQADLTAKIAIAEGELWEHAKFFVVGSDYDGPIRLFFAADAAHEFAREIFDAARGETYVCAYGADGQFLVQQAVAHPF